MRCISCLKEKRKEELDFTYKNVPFCSDGCMDFVKTLGIDGFIRYQMQHLEWIIRRISDFYKELEISGYYHVDEDVCEERKSEEIYEDIEHARQKMYLLEEQIEELKKHPEVRLKYLF